MQRSSGSIGGLAAALAKAQAELVNPEKSLVATIRADAPGSAARTFRYGPLSSGLDIVRKVLGQHEIATVQTTSVDQAAGIINLTTVLAHASGEWIASDWPVCAISETATPQRMGAALTYARRYALFTLVGIAGEDDIDAPDLTTPTNRTPGPEKSKDNTNSRLSGGQYKPTQRATVRRPTLEAEASAELRDRLIAELNDLGSTDDAAMWAHRSLVEKNRLTAADALHVEEIFQSRLGTLTSNVAADLPQPARETVHHVSPNNQDAGRPERRARFKAIDKSVLTLPEPRRVRDRDHVKFVAQQPCLLCGRKPSDAHHLRFVQSRALGRKVSDEFTVPLCRGHHREVHRGGDEAAWWRNAGIDPTISARTLWLETHPLPAGQGDKPAGAAEPLATTSSTDRETLEDDRNIGGHKSLREIKPAEGTIRHGIA